MSLYVLYRTPPCPTPSRLHCKEILSPKHVCFTSCKTAVWGVKSSHKKVASRAGLAAQVFDAPGTEYNRSMQEQLNPYALAWISEMNLQRLLLQPLQHYLCWLVWDWQFIFDKKKPGLKRNEVSVASMLFFPLTNFIRTWTWVEIIRPATYWGKFYSNDTWRQTLLARPASWEMVSSIFWLHKLPRHLPNRVGQNNDRARLCGWDFRSLKLPNDQ